MPLFDRPAATQIADPYKAETRALISLRMRPKKKDRTHRQNQKRAGDGRSCRTRLISHSGILFLYQIHNTGNRFGSYMYQLIAGAGGSREPGSQPPLPPSFFFENHAVFRQFVSKFWAQGPLGSKLHCPLTKILDPPLAGHHDRLPMDGLCCCDTPIPWQKTLKVAQCGVKTPRKLSFDNVTHKKANEEIKEVIL